MTAWINAHAGLIVLCLGALFLVLFAFQRTKGGPV
jgi:hypothetical protein